MTQEDNDETYSVIYAALKHPLRRKILRLLKEEELTYTQILNKLDVDTGHLNYYIESLGELLAKTSEGKYRLSEYGKAAVKLMAGVEETDLVAENERHGFSKRKLTRLTQVVCIIALILSGVFLMTINTVETYAPSRSGSLDSKDLKVILPNESIGSVDNANERVFPKDTLTTQYKTFYRVEIIGANASLQIQVSERILPAASFPSDAIERYYQKPTLIYNQTHEGPYGSLNEDGSYLFSKLSYTVMVPVKSPQEKGMLTSNSFAEYTLNVTNLGTATLYQHPADPSADGTLIAVPGNTATLNLQSSYPLIERTDYPYFYHGLILIILAVVTATLHYLFVIGRRLKDKRLTSSAA